MKVFLNVLLTIALFLSPKLVFAQAPGLGTAANFVLFSSFRAVTGIGVNHLNGNVGSNIAASIGFTNVNGIMHYITDGDSLEGRVLSTSAVVSVDGILVYRPIGSVSTLLTLPPTPSLASLACYALFSANGAVSNSGATTLYGDVGTNLGTTSGYTSSLINGAIHLTPDVSTGTAASDLATLYTYLNDLIYDIELMSPSLFGNNLVLTPHTYLLNAATTLTDTLYLDAETDTNAVFVILINGAFTTINNSRVILTNGTKAQNVYWKIDGAATINDNSVFNGTIVCNNGAILISNGATINGRALTTNGAITTTAVDVIANTTSIAGAITGFGTVYVGSTITFADCITGGAWSSNNANATVSGSGVVSGVSAGTATIRYIVSNLCGADTVTKTITILGMPSVCVGSSFTISDVTAGGVWSSRNGTATVIGGVITGASAGTDTIMYVVSTAISSDTASITVIINPLPNAGTITGITFIVCTGSAISLTDATTGGSWSSVSTGIATVNTGGSVSGVSVGTSLISYTVINSCGTDVAIRNITVNPVSHVWIGGADSNWNNTANWTCGIVPDATKNVSIPLVTTHSPVIYSGTGITYSIILTTGALVTVNSGATLNVFGNLFNSGTFNGSGNVILTGSHNQLIRGNGKMVNLELNNDAGATINSPSVNHDSLTLSGALQIATGNFNTNGGLVLAMQDTTLDCGAMVNAISGGSLTGNVIIQQYISGGHRAYRTFGHPFTSSIALNQLQNYIDITGADGASNGFTTTITNAPSAFWYHTLVGNSSITTGGGDPGWKAITSSYGTPDSNMWHQYQGMRIFIRGAKGEGLTGVAYTIDAATFRMYGLVNTGSFDMPLVKGTATVLGSPVQDYNQMSNPYPAPVDLAAVCNNASGQLNGTVFWIWNSWLGVDGAWDHVDFSTTTSFVIPANTSFQVRALNNGSHLPFIETNKATSIMHQVLKSATSNVISLNVFDVNYNLYDYLHVKFNDLATDMEDVNYDGGKPINPEVNFYSWSSDHHPLCQDARPYKAGSIIPLGFTSNTNKEYIIKVGQYGVSPVSMVYLHDKYLNKYELLEQGVEYKFAVTEDAASQGDSRFELGMGENESAVKFGSTNDLKVLVVPNPASETVNINYVATDRAATSVSILSISGVCVLSEDMGIQEKGELTLGISKLPSGIYLVAIISGNKKVITRLIKN